MTRDEIVEAARALANRTLEYIGGGRPEEWMDCDIEMKALADKVLVLTAQPSEARDDAIDLTALDIIGNYIAAAGEDIAFLNERGKHAEAAEKEAEISILNRVRSAISISVREQGAPPSDARVSEAMVPWRPEVIAFADLMERELRNNDFKTGWKGCRPEDLFAHLQSEVRELEEIFRAANHQIEWRKSGGKWDRGGGWSRLNPQTGEREVGSFYRLEGADRDALLTKVGDEAADIANMAMMVADVCRCLPLEAALALPSITGWKPTHARPISEYHEDMGNVLWWKFPINEPPYCGTPLDCGRAVEVTLSAHRVDKMMRANIGGWPGYHTHFTPLPAPSLSTSGGEVMALYVAAALEGVVWLYFAHVDTGARQVADYAAAYIAPTVVICTAMILRELRRPRS